MSHKSALATILIRCKRLGGGFVAVLLTICLSFWPARADTIFNVAGTFIDATTISGTFTINLTTGQIDAVNLLYGGGTYSTILLQQAFTGATAPGQTPVPLAYLVHIGSSTSTLPRIDLAMPGTSAVDSLVSYAGGSICSATTPCGPDQQGILWESAFFVASSTFVFLQAGELSAVPGPIAGAGLPGLVVAFGLLTWWRRRQKSA